MSQVRKDILNGWKQIGSYVGRDKRTVERWEKQRGLPVRRVPGEGRATVYALISELDEWLANTKIEEKEVVEDSITQTLVVVMEQDNAPVNETAAHTTTVIGATLYGNKPGSPGFVERRKSIEVLPILTTPAHRIALRVIAIAMVFCVIWALVWPLARSHAKNGVESSAPQSNQNLAGNKSDGSKDSKVSGVDALYLRGIYFYEQRTPESLEHALKDFSDAISKDPSYAPAYAGLANTYNLLREYSVMPDAEAYPKAKEAAEHAVALDPKLPEAHASLGFIDFFWSWDAPAAEREFKTALSLDPTSVVAHHWYGSMLMHEGRFDEALEQLNTAQRLEPTSSAILSTRALALGLSGHRDEAVDMLQDLLHETPGATSPHAMLEGLSKVQPRDPARYLSEMRRVGELRHSDEMLHVASAAEPAYRSGGEPAMWQAIFEEEGRLHPGPSNKTYLMVEAEAMLGHKDAAFADLRQLDQRRDPQLIGALIDPSFSSLHDDPRFGQLIAEIGFPPLQR